MFYQSRPAPVIGNREDKNKQPFRLVSERSDAGGLVGHKPGGDFFVILT